MNDEKLIEAAKLLQDFCKNEMKGACFSGNCPLVADGICGIYEPGRWKLPKPRRWTDNDIALAKALKAFGAESARKVGETVFVAFVNDDYRGVPAGAFANLKANEEIRIDKIIVEEEA